MRKGKSCASALLHLLAQVSKTVISSHLINHFVGKGLKTFFVVAQSSLIDQSYSKLNSIGIPTGIIKAGYDKQYDLNKPCQLVMQQSFSRRGLQDSITPDIIIVDEVDYGFSGNMYKNMVKQYPNAFVIGVTATPITNKGYLLPDFDYYYNDLQVSHLQKVGHLSINKDFTPFEVDVSNVRVMTTGEFNDKDLEEKCSDIYFINDVVKLYKSVDKGYKALCFAVSIKHAQMLNKAFQDAGFTSAVIHSKLKDWQVDYIIDSHKKGSTQILVNVGITTRGYDDPQIIDIIDTAPTMSERLFIQKVGRGARPDGTYNFFRYYDFGGNMNRFGRSWSCDSHYVLEGEQQKERINEAVICPMCFNRIEDKCPKCPNCGFILTEVREKKEREVIEIKRALELKQVEFRTGLPGLMDILEQFENINPNSFYFTKIYPLKPMKMDDNTFNNIAKSIANSVKRKGYNANYILNQIKKKIA